MMVSILVFSSYVDSPGRWGVDAAPLRICGLAHGCVSEPSAVLTGGHSLPPPFSPPQCTETDTFCFVLNGLWWDDWYVLIVGVGVTWCTPTGPVASR